MYTDDDDGDDWDEFFLMDLCVKLVLYFVGVIFSVLPRKVKSFPISLQILGLRLLSPWPQRGGISGTSSVRLSFVHCTNNGIIC